MKIFGIIKPLSGMCLLIALFWQGQAVAQHVEGTPGASTSNAAKLFAPAWTAVAPDRLQTMRGGYRLPSGLNLSFGIERVVFINGALVATTSVNIADIGGMTAAEAEALVAATGPLLIQNGPGNTFTAGNGPAGLTIQNSLDDQTISSLTTLNIAADTLGLYKSLNTQSTLQDAIKLSGTTP